ncbi:MAG TPA: non-homologous end-joining DNA ligase [Acidimicrobiales bacterium]|nr:non-homologous end-joining DNA ligase [Acidimicrobiales bacterium]
MAESALSEYHAKRNFGVTPEPAGEVPRAEEDGNRWVIQEHAARRLHYDFRLEVGGVLVSWAVPKGPSFDPSVKRLAVKVEDHPLDYREFEGIIPRANYGAGSVIVWDEGTYRNLTEKGSKPVPMEEAIAHGHVSVWLEGHKLKGGWSLTRFGADSTSWALVKRKDEFADQTRDITRDAPRSVKSGRTLEEVAQDPEARKWISNRGSGSESGAGADAGDDRAGDGGDRSSDAEARADDPGSAGAGGPGGHEAAGTGAGQQLAPATFLQPMLAQSEPTTPSGPASARGPLTAPAGEWLFETKLDGLRCIAVRNGKDVALFSRNELPFNARFPTIVSAVRSLPANNVVLDGELVGMVDRRPDFGALQDGNAADIEYWVFDMPWLLGQDLRHLSIEERKGLLAKAVPDEGPIRLVVPLSGEPRQLFTAACAQGLEGLVAKRAGSPYRVGRSSDWRKLKCECRQEMVIGGFTAPQGSRDDFGALLLGYWKGDDLVYAGKVGTGFTRATLRQLYKMLSSLERPSSPFAGGAGERGARWVEPSLVAEVTFSNWTRDGRLRHPSFEGLRTDKASRDVVREDCASRPPRSQRSKP